MVEYEAVQPPRRVVPLVNAELCGAQHLEAGFYKLAPGDISKNDTHEVEELYFVVSGTGRLVVDGQEFIVRRGMAVYLPPGCEHRTWNIGDDELCYFWVFGPPPGGEPVQIAEGWLRHEPRRSDGQHSNS
jgi:mannose-6-phosphate isomerase-like protein (cupin superfamily)